MRALGAGKTALFIAFLKDNSSHERNAGSGIVFYQNPDKVKFLYDMNESERGEYAAWVRRALNYAFSSDFDIIVLDKLLDAAALLDSREMAELPFDNGREYIITGHSRCGSLFDRADYITLMEKERHPFDKGQPARLGIEF
ncbi:MAG: cob(I)yrinic acid a,c-diamide adenosyltransferase [Clostridiales bacterium]|nr:cob(I)yrinic acid a,c-diamide adenosyltransferase [Clostridiales bacterium]